MASVYGYSFSASAVKYETESDNSSYLIIDEVVIEDENDDSVCAYTNIVFTCPENPSFGVTMNSQIYDVGGRYISVGFDDLDDIEFDDAGYGAGQLEELIYDHYPGESLVRHLNCDFEYNGSDLYDGEEFWLEYTNYDDGVNALPQRLFELMSSSKVVCIVTHGSSSGLKMSKNENENALLTKEQIQSLHDGYFSYCDLVVYLACASGSSIGSNSNLLNATVEKGAKAAVGFSTTVLMTQAQAFEYTFFSLMRKDGSQYWNPPLNEAANSNHTIRSAIEIASDYHDFRDGLVAYAGSIDRKLS